MKNKNYCIKNIHVIVAYRLYTMNSLLTARLRSELKHLTSHIGLHYLENRVVIINPHSYLPEFRATWKPHGSP